MVKKPRGEVMPFHNFTGSIRIKTGDTVTESNAFKVNMNWKKENEPKGKHGFYKKQYRREPQREEEPQEEYPCPDE